LTEKNENTVSEQPPGFFKRLRRKLNSGDSWLTYDLAKLAPGGKIDADVLEDLESRLVMADVGIDATEKIIAGLQQRLARHELKDVDTLTEGLRQSMIDILEPVQHNLVPDARAGPFVILMVGVNGAGKTTTIGKLARRFLDDGYSVMLAAGDTFRAAAVPQLEIWAERAEADIVRAQQGADPAAVAFDAVSAALARDTDVLLVDTAGRLHTKVNLMEELKKIRRSLGKQCPGAPHETLLVLDATTGQNALSQARQFHLATDVTALALTKLDGTAKGGIVFALRRELGIPIKLIGIGEGENDLQPFDGETFVEALLER